MAYTPQYITAPHINYGFASNTMTPQQQADERYKASLAAQFAGQQYQNQAQGIRNQGDAQQMQQQLAAMGLNYQGDAIQRQMQVGRMGESIAALQANQRDAAMRSQMNLAQLQQNYRMQQANAQENLMQTAYQRSNSEIKSPMDIWNNKYGFR